MNNIKYLLLFILVIFISFSCDDIFVKNISNSNVSITSPVESSILKSEETTFLWELLEHADDYHIVVVSPSFNAIQTYVCDSIVKTYRLTLPLSPGDYEWAIQARNYGYVSQKRVTSFKVEQP